MNNNIKHIYDLVMAFLNNASDEEIVEIYSEKNKLYITFDKTYLKDELGNIVSFKSKEEQEEFLKLLIGTNELILDKIQTYHLGDKSLVIFRIKDDEFYTFYIKKHQTKYYIFDDLLKKEMFNTEVAKFLELLMKLQTTVVITGTQGSGKTTLQNSLLNFVDSDRMLETDFESLNIYGKEEKLVLPEDSNDRLDVILKMSPSYINYGELSCDKDYLIYYKLVISGHPGIVAYHASDSDSAFCRLKTALLANNLNIPDEDICKLMNYVITVDTLGDGTRKIVGITEVYYENNKVIYNDIYKPSFGDIVKKDDKVIKIEYDLKKNGSISENTIINFKLRGIEESDYQFLL